MLSRVGFRAGNELRPALCGVVNTVNNLQEATRGSATDSSQRDLVNFPDLKRPIYSSPTRHGFIPESAFQFFYKKTGVSGPYVFGATVTTYLLSKEWWVMDHELNGAGPLIMATLIIHNKYGDKISAAINRAQDAHEAAIEKEREDSMRAIEQEIEDTKKEVWRAEGSHLLYDAKKEAVKIQLEAAYRERLLTAYRQVKNKLDYQVEILDVQRRIAQKNLVSWISNEVLKSITAQQEQESLKKCISDLKLLASSARA